MTLPRRHKNPRFEVYPSHYSSKLKTITRPDWRWRLYAKNGEIIAHGEGYATEQSANSGVAAIRRAVALIERREEAEKLYDATATLRKRKAEKGSA